MEKAMLYNAKSTKNHEVLQITKFDGDFAIEASYLVGPKTCECPGFTKAGRCRHLQMRAMFRAQRRVDSDWFLAFDTREWRRHEEVAVGNGQMLVDRVVDRHIDELEIGGIAVVSLDNPKVVHNVIAAAVGDTGAFSGLSAPVAPGVEPPPPGAIIRRRFT
jgi:hypothetical protein